MTNGLAVRPSRKSSGRATAIFQVLLALGMGMAGNRAAKAQGLTTLWDFCSVRPAPYYYCADGEEPYAPLLQGSDGNFYGTTYADGSNGGGTFFQLTPQGTLTTLYSFCAVNTPLYCEDGSAPYGGLVEGSDGNFYGTTVSGGANGSSSYGLYGTVYEITSSGTLTTLYSFCPQHPDCPDGTSPHATLTVGSDGSLYGSTVSGGSTAISGGGGTIFQIGLESGLTTIYTFCAQVVEAICQDGSSPWGGMVMGTDGNLYGTTVNGGTHGLGTVFKLTTGGTLTTLHTFCSEGGGACTDGANPYGALIQGTDGNFYGTTLNGGTPQGTGTAFKITSEGTLTTLYRFCALEDCADGANPVGGLVEGTDGNFYGTTEAYGANEYGTAFQLTPGGTLTTLYNFCSEGSGNYPCTDGANPNAALIQGNDGNFYGTALNGGTGGGQGDGTAFKLVVLATATLSASSLVFPAQTVGTTSSAQTITLTDNGNVRLAFISIETGGDFSEKNTCGTTLSAGADCTILVTFKPKGAGAVTGTLLISDSAPGSPQLIALSGTGIAFSSGPKPPTPTRPPTTPGPGQTTRPATPW